MDKSLIKHIVLFFILTYQASCSSFILFLGSEFRIFRFFYPEDEITLNKVGVRDEFDQSENIYAKLSADIDSKTGSLKPNRKIFSLRFQNKDSEPVIFSMDRIKFKIMHTMPEYQQLELEIFDKEKIFPTKVHFTCDYHKNVSPSWKLWRNVYFIEIYSKSSCFFEFPILTAITKFNIFFAFIFCIIGLILAILGLFIFRMNKNIIRITIVIITGFYTALLLNELNFEKLDMMFSIFMTFLFVVMILANVLMFENGIYVVLSLIKMRYGFVVQWTLFSTFFFRTIQNPESNIH